MGLSRNTFGWLRDGIGNLAAAREIESALFGGYVGTDYFVSSTSGSDTGSFDGLSPSTPLATLEGALAKVSANAGDRIFLMPGHVEDISSTPLDIDTAGVSVIGLGHGSARPRFDFNHASASIDIGASGCVLANVQLRPSVTVVGIGIDVEAGVTDTLLQDLTFLPGEAGDGTDEFVLGIDVKAGCTRTHVRGLSYAHHASADGPVAAVKFTGASDLCVVEDFDITITGTAAVAGINGDTTLSTRMTIRDGVIVSDAEPGIEMLTGTTGVIQNVMVRSDLATIAAAIVADAMARFECYYSETGAETGVLIGTQSADD